MINLEENEDFMLQGKIGSLFYLEPSNRIHFKYGLLPLHNGQLPLPKLIIDIITPGKVTEPVLDKSFEPKVFVFPI